MMKSTKIDQVVPEKNFEMYLNCIIILELILKYCRKRGTEIRYLRESMIGCYLNNAMKKLSSSYTIL